VGAFIDNKALKESSKNQQDWSEQSSMFDYWSQYCNKR